MFDRVGAMDKMAGFVSRHGPGFYRLPVNDAEITLLKGAPVTYPAQIQSADGPVTVFDPGFDLHWRVAE